MNDDDLGRRRRLTPSGPRRSSGGGNSWAITIAAAIVVVIAGWFLGMALARFANVPKKQTTTTVANVAPSPTASPAETPSATPSPAATATPAKTPKPSPNPKTTATAAPTPSSSPVPTTRPTVKPSAPPTPVPTPVRTASPRRTMPVLRRPAPTPARVAPPPAQRPSNAAEVTVRSYIEALRNGDPQQAAAYLGNGSVDENFINASTRIINMNTAREADGSFVVAVTLATAQGNYLETFDVSSPADGSKILQKSVSKL